MMAKNGTNIVRRSLGELGATSRARELGRAVLGLLGRYAPGSVRLGGSVSRVMTRDVSTCSNQDSLQRAAQIMWDEDCGAVPVVNAQGQVDGVVTDRDICMAAYTQGRALSEVPVSTVLSGRVHVCAPEEPLDDAIATMRRHQVRRLVVVDGARRVVGMLSLADVARQVASLMPVRRDAALVAAELLGAVSERRTDAVSARAAE